MPLCWFPQRVRHAVIVSLLIILLLASVHFVGIGQRQPMHDDANNVVHETSADRDNVVHRELIFDWISNWLARIQDGLEERNFVHGGLSRYFLEHQPSNFAGMSSLVIVLHGGTGDMYGAFGRRRQDNRPWLTLSEDNGFLLLIPNGTSRSFFGFGPVTGSGSRQNWNDFRGDDGPAITSVDDVGFIAALVQWAMNERNIDPSRVYVTGASNGGMMTHRLLIERPDLFAAGATFVANLPSGQVPEPVSPTPLFLMNGSEDPLAPWEGGEIASDRGQVRSAFDTRDYFVRVMGADSTGVVEEQLPDLDEGDGCILQSQSFPGGDGQPVVVFYTMAGGGHTIPFTAPPSAGLLGWLTARRVGTTCKDVDGVILAWEFMSQYSLA